VGGLLSGLLFTFFKQNMNKVDIIWSWNADAVWEGGSYGNPRMRSFGSMTCLMNISHEMRVSLQRGVEEVEAGGESEAEIGAEAGWEN
jgi:hypothetical protein